MRGKEKTKRQAVGKDAQCFHKALGGDNLLIKPARKYHVILTAEDRLVLERAARSNKRSFLEQQRAHLLLASARGEGDAAIAQEQKVSLNTVANVRRRVATAVQKENGAGPGSVLRAVQTKRKDRVLEAGRERPWWPWSVQSCLRDARPGR